MVSGFHYIIEMGGGQEELKCRSVCNTAGFYVSPDNLFLLIAGNNRQQFMIPQSASVPGPDLQNRKQSRLERISGDQLTQPLCSAATGFSRSYLFKFFKSPSRETLNVLGQPVLLFSHSYSDFKKTKQKLTLSSISCTSGNTSGPCA